MCFLGRLEALEFGSSSRVDGFGLHEEAEDYCGAGKGCLEPEYVAPGAEGDDDASDEWTWSRQHNANVGTGLWGGLPSAGPISVPDKNQPSAVPRSV